MEFFVPGILFFILTVLFTFYVAPKATPMIAAILSLVFLTYGVYDHYHMFASEYHNSTWQEPLLLIYSPAVMITILILYVLYGMATLFSNGQVPIPSMPTIPSVNEVMNNITDSLSNAANSIGNKANNTLNKKSNSGNSGNSGNSRNSGNSGNSGNSRNNASTMSRSFVESV